MLERVALGQTRFATPGLSVDARGVALGRYGVLLFPALDGVVGWLRVYSDDAGLDEVLAELRIQRVRSQVGARAFVVIVPAQSSYQLDRAARCARLWGGQTFTGSSRHFVRFRDEKSPYGWDVVETAASGSAGDLVLHGHDGAQAYKAEGDLEVRTLIFRLSLARVPGGERLDAEGRQSLLLAVPPGLAAGVLRYLWRSRVTAEVAKVALAPEAQSEFARPGTPDGYLLARVTDLPERILGSFLGTPGMSLYRPVTENVAVEVGWRHPIELSTASALFERDRLYLFSGSRDAVDVIAGPVEMADARHLTELDLDVDLAQARERPGQAVPADTVGLELRLTPSLLPARRVVGTLIDWNEADRLKKLVYMLPPSLLRGHRVAPTERGFLLVAGESVEIIPLGTLLCELTSGLLLPLGMEITPRVAPEVLAEALGHGPGRLTVFTHEGKPFYVADSELKPLERRTLAALDVPRARAQDLSARPPAEDPRVINDPVGAFALWGYPAPRARKPGAGE